MNSLDVNYAGHPFFGVRDAVLILHMAVQVGDGRAQFAQCIAVADNVVRNFEVSSAIPAVEPCETKAAVVNAYVRSVL